MMKTYEESVEINHSLNWPYILGHTYEILVIDGSVSSCEKSYYYT